MFWNFLKTQIEWKNRYLHFHFLIFIVIFIRSWPHEPSRSRSRLDRLHNTGQDGWESILGA